MYNTKLPSVSLWGVVLVCQCLSMAAAYAFSPGTSTVQDETGGRLVYTREQLDSCDIVLWQMKSGVSRRVASATKCPNKIAVTRHGQTLILLNDSSLQVIDLSSGGIGNLLSAPQPKMLKGYGANVTRVAGGRLQAIPSNAGYDLRGDLMVVMNAPGRASDDYFYLFAYLDDAWKQIEEIHCGTYELPSACRFKHKFDGRVAGDPWDDDSAQIWGDGNSANPYFVKRVALPTPPSDEAEPGAQKYGLIFGFGSGQSTLSYVSFPGPDMGDTLTQDLQLELPGGKSIVLAHDQFAAQVMGHYVFFGEFGVPGQDLVNLADGRTVLENLIGPAGWVY